jgi:putative glutathione S-transferase
MFSVNLFKEGAVRNYKFTASRLHRMTHHASKDGHFHRVASKFRSSVSRDPSSEFPAEKGRYVLYMNYGCPWAHRTNLVRSLKGLEDVIQLVAMDWEFTSNGWFYSGRDGTAPEDPLYGFKLHRQLYEKADPEYTGKYTVPVLWDKKKETIVNNESSEIIRMLYSEFDEFLPEEKREKISPLLPESLKKEIDEMNEWVYDLINNGVYKTGFAASQEAYDKNVFPLFEALDRVEKHLGEPGHSPYLFGSHITEADIRLFPTIVRFDVAYYTLFKCNLRMIRHDYPNIHAWLRRLYWDESKATNGAFKSTTNFGAVRILSVAVITNEIDQERIRCSFESTDRTRGT